MKLYTVRLRSGQDLRLELLAFAKKENIQAGSIVTGVGGLHPAVLRLTSTATTAHRVETYADYYEIVSLAGTITADDCHLHLAMANKDGTAVGGHLKPGSLVYMTAEVVMAEDELATYTRVPDADSGFAELVVGGKPDTERSVSDD